MFPLRRQELVLPHGAALGSCLPSHPRLLTLSLLCRLSDGNEYLFQAKDEVSPAADGHSFLGRAVLTTMALSPHLEGPGFSRTSGVWGLFAFPQPWQDSTCGSMSSNNKDAPAGTSLLT